MKPPFLHILIAFGIVVSFMVGLGLTQARRQNAENLQLVQDYRFVVQAICDYRAVHGWLPEDLEDLVSQFLPTNPGSTTVQWIPSMLTIRGHFLPNGGVAYSFRKEDEGWTTAGIPKVEPTPPKLTGNELIRARLKELDRRIATKHDELAKRAKKIAYLVLIGRRQDAETECEALAKVAPNWWKPQFGMALLARPEQSAVAETRFQKWADAHASFVHYWCLAQYYRDRRRPKDALAALKQAAKYPAVDGDFSPTPTSLPGQALALDAAMYSCEQRDPQLTLDITKAWSSGINPAWPSPPMDYCAFRAAANLGLGNFDAARKDVATTIEWSTTRFRKPRSVFYAGNLENLREAIERGDRTFVYDPGELARSNYGKWDWLWPGLLPDEL